MLDKLMASLDRRWSVWNSGAAAVEFAITAPLLAMLALGFADYGILMNSTAGIESASRAGGEVAKINPSVSGATLTSAGVMPSGVTPTVSAPFCTCFDNTSVTCPAPGGGAANPCAAKTDTRVLRYVTVTAAGTLRRSKQKRKRHRRLDGRRSLFPAAPRVFSEHRTIACAGPSPRKWG
jgi:hypothetical protein